MSSARRRFALPLLLCAAHLPLVASAAVIEFYNPDLDNYFITADPSEQAMIDTGAVGRWQRTGIAFATGGPNQVCRFYGNAAINPATGSFYGPNSHFYTADPAECAGLKAQFTPNAKSWKFESNDFLTTPAVGGACPAGLVPVYRAYNNGFVRGVDSNHRITSSQSAYLQTVAAGATGEGVVMCAPAGSPPATATAVGLANGAAASGILGAAGGSVRSADGRLVLTLPPGALVADTTIGVQPLFNFAHGGIGPAYRLTPAGQTFAKPVTLTFTYTDQDLVGTAADFLGAAFQTAAGYWQWAGDPVVDPAARTVSVASTHFSDWSNVKGLQIRPPAKTVRVNESVGLQVKVCYQIEDGDLTSLMRDCDTDQEVVSTLSINEWSVNAVAGGNGTFGTVSGSGSSASYKAPATKPAQNTVAVSARVHHPNKPNAKILVVSNITIEDQPPGYTGTVHFTTDTGIFSIANGIANVTWSLIEDTGDTRKYKPTGTISGVMTLNGCSTVTASGDLGAAGNNMVVYTASNSAHPKTHGFALAADMNALLTFDCGGNPVQFGKQLYVYVGSCAAAFDPVPFADAAALAGSYNCGLTGTNATWSFTAQ